jgi:hypothetical protein
MVKKLVEIMSLNYQEELNSGYHTKLY